ncbi:hypothetical protein OAP07_05560 [Bacteroidia bacterium]|jgi:hypothetical protein|nr:hypothetical protein [Bacteroidia bacterium]MDC0468364.1 hypothetical protein [Bacteroidia bacterium]MDC0561524.1 hypothetical protein [Bacteroidia bacterium]
MNEIKEETIKEKWFKIRSLFEKRFNKSPDLSAILYVIGMRELGKHQTEFKKEEKVRLMHIATCRILSTSGHYVLKGLDSKDWPVWELVEKLPNQDMIQQELYLRHHIIHYFEEEELI